MQVGGNIGTALISMVETSRDDGWTVVELSSFQLETIVDFHPTVALVLNVTPNHMDRYETMTDYAAAKHRIFRNQTAGDVAILNADDEIVSSWAQGLARARRLRSACERELEEGLFLRNGREIVSRTRGWRAGADDARRDAAARAAQRRERAGGAGRRAWPAALRPIRCARRCGDFKPVEHRLEFVAEIDGVKFYNDSKATSVDATLKALEAFADEDGQGGLDPRRARQASARMLRSLRSFARACAQLILIGEDADTIEKELKDDAPMERADDMQRCRARALTRLRRPGDMVLLAPACASFDMFKSFEHRGRVFKEAVKKSMQSLKIAESDQVMTESF